MEARRGVLYKLYKLSLRKLIFYKYWNRSIVTNGIFNSTFDITQLFKMTKAKIPIDLATLRDFLFYL